MREQSHLVNPSNSSARLTTPTDGITSTSPCRLIRGVSLSRAQDVPVGAYCASAVRHRPDPTRPAGAKSLSIFRPERSGCQRPPAAAWGSKQAGRRAINGAEAGARGAATELTPRSQGEGQPDAAAWESREPSESRRRGRGRPRSRLWAAAATANGRNLGSATATTAAAAEAAVGTAEPELVHSPLERDDDWSSSSRSAIPTPLSPSLGPVPPPSRPS